MRFRHRTESSAYRLVEMQWSQTLGLRSGSSPGAIVNAALFYADADPDKAMDLMARANRRSGQAPNYTLGRAYLDLARECIHHNPPISKKAARAAMRLLQPRYGISSLARSLTRLSEIGETALLAGQLALCEEVAEFILSRHHRAHDSGDWYHRGHLLLGLAALHAGETQRALELLERSLDRTGPGVISSFGPSLTVLAELRESGLNEARDRLEAVIRDKWPATVAATYLGAARSN